MTIRPILGADDAPTPPQSHADALPPTTQRAPESPLASQLPPWDLVPSDLLLVRRRPART